MGMDAGTPPGLPERIRQIVATELAKFARSGFLRNASISDGGLTIKGGFLRLLSKATGGVTLFYIGPTGPALPDGTPQQGMIVRRGDGTTVLDLFDADVSDGQLNQALNWRDRGGNTVFADDTNSGQGLARPYLHGGLYPNRYGDFTEATTSATDVWETVLTGQIPRQQPRLEVAVRATMDTDGATGEVRVLVNGTQMGDVQGLTFSVAPYLFGAFPVPGTYMAPLQVEVQVRRRTGAGGCRATPMFMQGVQS